MRYEEFVKKVCGENWRNDELLISNGNQKEYHGGLGVGIVMSLIKGIRLNINDLSNHLSVPAVDLEAPLSRLYRNGAFSDWDVRNDENLLAFIKSSKDEEGEKAWCFIAAYSSGFIGV